ncbi:GTP cyclohydrolase II [Oceanicola sp. 502str15]|uniref:GTP cyclohydrolase II n=1 Tax=Oceanicola sp. 502str15 TaxID=2696061 RepID=UPI0020963D94|nr:GTP cyclohydrolase II [Oceanicola sp. 502str15]MCO6384517.1 GTP cyclohydrolase II [Oceanicola sp. 502str15]
MSLLPTPQELRARARADLRLGLPVVIVGAAGEAALVMAAEQGDSARVGEMAAAGAYLAITLRRAETLKARAYDGDMARLRLPAEGAAAWAAAVADPASDLATPMKGPFTALRGSEGCPEIARAGIRLAKEARVLPAVLVAPLAGPAPEGLTRIAAEASHDLAPFAEAVSARLPMHLAGRGKLHVFRPDDGAEEHYVVEVGRPDRDAPVLTRLHSACFTGDVLGSLKCDCGPQLHAALAAMGEAGGGLLLYLNQEGRGIGLANKMRAYSLQDQGFDTVEANHRLGFEDDERDFRIGAALLGKMGVGRVRLMTNNPAKIAMMTAQGIEVAERVPLKVGRTPENAGYLATKAAKSGHLL